MPPLTKISKEMILNSGIEIIRNDGIASLNARNIAKKLNCSTQPIMYHYKNMNLLKEDLYIIADNYHSEFIMEENDKNNPLLNIGLQYIKFAVYEKNLFKFIFQSDKFSNFNFEDLINNNENGLEVIFETIQKEIEITKEQSRNLFELLFITAHGLASLFANNSMKYDENYCVKILEDIFKGTLMKMKGEIDYEKNI